MPNPGSRFLLRAHVKSQIQEAALRLGQSNRAKAVAWMTDLLWTMEQLAAEPMIGVAYPVGEEAQLHSLRRYRVRHHRAYWIYYRPFVSGNGIEVFGVIHEKQSALRQLETALDEE